MSMDTWLIHRFSPDIVLSMCFTGNKLISYLYLRSVNHSHSVDTAQDLHSHSRGEIPHSQENTKKSRAGCTSTCFTESSQPDPSAEHWSDTHWIPPSHRKEAPRISSSSFLISYQDVTIEMATQITIKSHDITLEPNALRIGPTLDGCLTKQMRRRSQTNTTGASRANVDGGAATRPDDVR